MLWFHVVDELLAGVYEQGAFTTWLEDGRINRIPAINYIVIYGGLSYHLSSLIPRTQILQTSILRAFQTWWHFLNDSLVPHDS